jgi:hypothetical protein
MVLGARKSRDLGTIDDVRKLPGYLVLALWYRDSLTGRLGMERRSCVMLEFRYGDLFI